MVLMWRRACWAGVWFRNLPRQAMKNSRPSSTRESQGLGKPSLSYQSDQLLKPGQFVWINTYWNFIRKLEISILMQNVIYYLSQDHWYFFTSEDALGAAAGCLLHINLVWGQARKRVLRSRAHLVEYFSIDCRNTKKQCYHKCQSEQRLIRDQS